jgi:hypothetical protein
MANETTLPAGHELDALVAERVMGENLTPPRGYALAIVGGVLTSVTGKDWKLRNGRTVYMPDGETLAQPDGTTDYNARYYAHAAEHSGEDVEALVAKVRHTPKPYSTDIAAAWRVVEKLRADGWIPALRYDVRLAAWCVTLLTPTMMHEDIGPAVGWAETAAEAICRAALAATPEHPPHSATDPTHGGVR